MLMNIKENYINDEKLPDNCNYEVEQNNVKYIQVQKSLNSIVGK